MDNKLYDIYMKSNKIINCGNNKAKIWIMLLALIIWCFFILFVRRDTLPETGKTDIEKGGKNAQQTQACSNEEKSDMPMADTETDKTDTLLDGEKGEPLKNPQTSACPDEEQSNIQMNDSVTIDDTEVDGQNKVSDELDPIIVEDISSNNNGVDLEDDVENYVEIEESDYKVGKVYL